MWGCIGTGRSRAVITFRPEHSSDTGDHGEEPGEHLPADPKPHPPLLPVVLSRRQVNCPGLETFLVVARRA